ncbi:Retrovirus-related Pol polyprotein from transposon opus [Gossypium australe]|uniref:Retrovirus-related Pol polyprotein from transposon opus n=1 Tax=Gossypium australe TaxID=47621 RepID=A0A5B6VAX6_9ROSI|nr:Retrovirus-related Pol polyprotein from transposon opus [Gossypium australe]
MLINILPPKLKDPGSFTIPYSISNHYKIGNWEGETATITLHLADYSYAHLKADKKVPIILGRPFLATGRTLIDVQKDSVELNEEQLIEELSELMEAKQLEDGSRRSFESLNLSEQFDKSPRPSIEDPLTL